MELHIARLIQKRAVGREKFVAFAFGATLLTGMCSSANAIVINAATPVGQTWNASWNYLPNDPSTDPTVSAAATLEFLGMSSGLWNFNLVLENNSTDTDGNSTISSWGFGTTPDVTSFTLGTITGGDGENWVAVTDGPNGSDSATRTSLGAVDNCAYAGSNCEGGQSLGIEIGETTSFAFSIGFAQGMVNEFTLDNAYIRVQSIGAVDDSAKLLASQDFTTSNEPPPIPVPAAAWLFGSGLIGLFGIARKRTLTA